MNGHEKSIPDRLGQFCVDPSRYKYKKLADSQEMATFRLRHGSFRILFDFDFANKIILIYRIKQRKEGYE